MTSNIDIAPGTSDLYFDPRWYEAVIGENTWHFHRRLYERYGVVLGPRGYTRIIKDISRKRALKIKQKSGGAWVYMIWIPPLIDPVFIVFRKGSPLLTAMPPSEKLMAMVPWTQVLEGNCNGVRQNHLKKASDGGANG